MSFLLHLLWIPAGLFFANLIEWVFHRFILHGLGKRKNSWWAFHWSHHSTARKYNYFDADYSAEPWSSKAMGRETLALGVGAVLVGFLFWQVSIILTLTLWYSIANYYRVHRRSHLDTEWARVNLPWHWDHHMGKNQNANWCITKPWCDNLFGTRIEYPETRK